MKYTQIADREIKHMLDVIGVRSIDDLFATVPAELRCRGPLDIPDGLDELALLEDASALASRNRDCSELVCFLGGGAYDHFIPTVVDAMSAQSEFLTAYTPYQAEASQGILQIFYEFQTMICQLTGSDVANASLYEGASAAAEAVMMATGVTKRSRVLVSAGVHPDTLRVLRTYSTDRGIDIVSVPLSGGVTKDAELAGALDDSVAAVVIQSPNFFGCLERLDRLIPAIRATKALAIVATDPLSCGMFKSPGAFGADLVVGEGQSLGIPLQYGGPYLGLLAGRAKYLRKMPGRVVGMTTDRDGRRAFCLALQTREQHIKRERATSNVCTNQGLMATRAAMYLAVMGKQGIARVANLCFDKAHYAARVIASINGYELRFDGPFFKEFVVRTTRGVDNVLAVCRERGILGGVSLARFDERYGDCFSVAVTEKRSKQQIDALAAALDAA